MRRSSWCAGIAVAVALAAPAAASAQGSAVMTHGSCATAMGAAGVASPCDDGSAVLFNPAALAHQPSVVSVGWSGITTSGSFTYDRTLERIERPSSTASVPFGYASYRFDERLAAGIGVFAPYGLGIDWPQEFEGRFVSYDTDLRNIYIQPTVAYQLTPMISIGAGVDVVLASIDINQFVDLATTPLPTQPIEGQTLTFANLGIPLGTDFARAGLSGEGTGYGFHLGAQARLGEVISAGVRYLHSVDIDYDGDATFSQVETDIVLPAGNPLSVPGNPYGIPAGVPVPLDDVLATQFAAGQALANQAIATSLTLPRQLVVGVAIQAMPTLKLLADYQWTGWSSFDVAQIDFAGAGPDQPLVLDYQDTDTYRLGADFSATDALSVRAGFIYNTAAEKDASVSPLLPEAERNYYSAGLGYRFANGLSIDAAYQFIDQSDRRGRVRGRSSLEQTAEQLNVGLYEVDASLFNVTLSYRFGANR